MNAADTDRRIADAVARLQTAGKRLTQAAIAAEAGVSERTVRSRWPKPAKQCPSGIGLLAPDLAPPNGATPIPSPVPDKNDRRASRTLRARESRAQVIEGVPRHFVIAVGNHAMGRPQTEHAMAMAGPACRARGDPALLAA